MYWIGPHSIVRGGDGVFTRSTRPGHSHFTTGNYRRFNASPNCNRGRRLARKRLLLLNCHGPFLEYLRIAYAMAHLGNILYYYAHIDRIDYDCLFLERKNKTPRGNGNRVESFYSERRHVFTGVLTFWIIAR